MYPEVSSVHCIEFGENSPFFSQLGAEFGFIVSFIIFYIPASVCRLHSGRPLYGIGVYVIKTVCILFSSCRQESVETTGNVSKCGVGSDNEVLTLLLLHVQTSNCRLLLPPFASCHQSLCHLSLAHSALLYGTRCLRHAMRRIDCGCTALQEAVGDLLARLALPQRHLLLWHPAPDSRQ